MKFFYSGIFISFFFGFCQTDGIFYKLGEKVTDNYFTLKLKLQ